MRLDRRRTGVSLSSHFRFKIDAEAIGDAVDVVEKRYDLRGVVDRTVREPERSETVDIRLRDGGGRLGQLDGVVAERAIELGQLRLRIIGLDPPNPFIIVDLSPEVFRMGLDSVITIVRLRYDDCEHLTLRTRQRRIGQHRAAIELDHGLERPDVVALNLEDVEDPPRPPA